MEKKDMKRNLLLVLICFGLMSTFPIFANDENNNYEEEEDCIELQEERNTSGRPNTTDLESMYCFIKGNNIALILPKNINYATVSINNYIMGWIGTVTKEMNSISVPLPSGIYKIEVYTNDGRVFTGIINL